MAPCHLMCHSRKWSTSAQLIRHRPVVPLCSLLPAKVCLLLQVRACPLVDTTEAWAVAWEVAWAEIFREAWEAVSCLATTLELAPPSKPTPRWICLWRKRPVSSRLWTHRICPVAVWALVLLPAAALVATMMISLHVWPTSRTCEKGARSHFTESFDAIERQEFSLLDAEQN